MAKHFRRIAAALLAAFISSISSISRISSHAFAEWPRTTPHVSNDSAAVVGDIDGDGSLEIIAPAGAQLYALNIDGTLEPSWLQNPAPVTPSPVDGSAFSSPWLGDLDGDPQTLEILLTSLHLASPGQSGYLNAYDSTGRAVTRRALSAPTWAPPAVRDNRDGTHTVFLSLMNGYLGAYLVGRADRVNPPPLPPPVLPAGPVQIAIRELYTVQFPRPGSPVFSAPAIGDIDRDGRDEVVFGGGHSGKLLAMRADTQSPGAMVLDIDLPEGPLFASPVLANFTGDEALEIAVGLYTGRLIVYPGNAGTRNPPPLVDLRLLRPIPGTPAAVDLDLDGYAEIAVLSGSESVPGPVYLDAISIGTSPGGRQLFSVLVHPDTMLSHSPVVAADFLRSGRPDLRFATGGLRLGRQPRLYLFNADGVEVPQSTSQPIWGDIWVGPAVADLDGEGAFETIFLTMYGQINVVDSSGGQFAPVPGGQIREFRPWPDERGPQNRGAHNFRPQVELTAGNPSRIRIIDPDGLMTLDAASLSLRLDTVDSTARFWELLGRGVLQLQVGRQGALVDVLVPLNLARFATECRICDKNGACGGGTLP